MSATDASGSTPSTPGSCRFEDVALTPSSSTSASAICSGETASKDINEDELCRLCAFLIEERDCLKTELRYANFVIDQLTSQVEESNALFNNQHSVASQGPPARQAFPPASASLPSKDATSSDKRLWIWDIWLPTATDNYFLGPAETAFRESRWQEALNLLSSFLLQRNIAGRTRINAKLLMSTVLRVCDQPCQALVHAEEALQIAHRHSLLDMVGKAQFFRATCLFDAGDFADASWCLSLAAGTANFAAKIDEWKGRAETARLTLPATDEGKYISSGFRRIPPVKDFGNADALLE